MIVVSNTSFMPQSTSTECESSFKGITHMENPRIPLIKGDPGGLPSFFLLAVLCPLVLERSAHQSPWSAAALENT
jgi:hypothetical protein